LADILGTSSTTTSIKVGETKTSALEVKGDHDWFKITLNAGQEIIVTLNGVTLEDPYLYIRNSAGNVVKDNDDISAGVIRDSKLSFVAPTAGTYYIDVGAFAEDYTGTYELSVKPYTPPPLGTLDQIANQLVEGYWGGDDHHFNVTQGGSISVNVTGLTPAGQNLAREALSVWADAIGITFREVTTGGQIKFDDEEEGAYADGNWSNGITSSAFVNVSKQWLTDYGTSLEDYPFQTYIHEIGHALGLGHAGNYNGSAEYRYDALYSNEGWPTSVMSYFNQTENTYFSEQGFSAAPVTTPMLGDLVAVSRMYGLSTTTRTGDTTYGFNSNAGRAMFDASKHPGVAYTVFDSGGNDTLDYSGFGARQLINLESEAFSNVGGLSGNIAIARGTTIENAIGGSGSDEIRGNAAANRLEGRAGNDELFGAAGNDLLIGGAGDDRLIGGSGADTAGYAGATGAVAVDLGAGSAKSLGANDAAGIGLDTLVEIENVVGSAHADTITGNAAANRLEGGAGNDVIDGAAGADQMVGAAGDDVFYVDSSGDSVVEAAGEGSDHVHSSVTYVLGANIERLTLRGTTAISATGNALANALYGNAAANALYGLAGDDSLFGEAGNDRLDGGAGADRMTGGQGNDSYYVDSGSDVTIELAGEGTDHVHSTGSYTLKANVERLTLLGTSNASGTGNELGNALTGNAAANRLYGLDGADTLRGQAGNDRLDGGAGGDKMYGGAGNDRYYVNASTDAAYENAGEGTDTVQASVGHTLRANVENLTLTGTGNIVGKGNDLANTITGNVGANSLYGFGGDDRISGGEGNDRLFGGLGADHLNGASGDDRLIGEDGADLLYGRDGADVLDGGAGRDRMFGGLGGDKFVFDDGDFGGATASTADQVHDFSKSQSDLLSLSLVDANVNVSGDQAFAFIGSAAFSGTAGELRFEQGSTHTFVYGDTNGDGVADFAIRVDGLHALGSSDFLL
jgi:serralysin